MIGAGWLYRDDTLPYEVNGVAFRTTDPTRREEYHWAAKAFYGVGIDAGNYPVVFDAGCGFDPTIHLFPYMLAKHAKLVIALDANPEHLAMPAAPGILRFVGDMADTGTITEIADVWTCISVLEHLSPEERAGAFRSAFQILRPGGHIVITADEINPILLTSWAIEAGFKTGPIVAEPESDLSPKISYLVAQKP